MKLINSKICTLIICFILFLTFLSHIQYIMYDIYLSNGWRHLRHSEFKITPSGLTDDLDEMASINKPSSVSANLNLSNVLNYKAKSSFPYMISQIERASYAVESQFTSTFSYQKNSINPNEYFSKSFDKFHNQFVFSTHQKINNKWKKTNNLYIGPKGSSPKPDSKIGTFKNPLIQLAWMQPESPENSYPIHIIYDYKSKRFYRLDYFDYHINNSELKITEGPTSLAGTPIAFITDDSMPNNVWLHWEQPTRKTNEGLIKPMDDKLNNHLFGYHTLVLLDTGRIAVLDNNTLKWTYAKAAGLTKGRSQPVEPEKLSGYDIMPIFRDQNYFGYAVANLSKSCDLLTINVFDKDGIRVKQDSVARTSHYYGESSIFATRFILSNLRPALLELLSYVVHKDRNANEGLLDILLPTTTIAAEIANSPLEGGYGFFVTFVWSLPGIILSLILAVLVQRNATKIGLTKSDRRYWVLATALLGLIGYIAYRINRPKTKFVTCKQCGDLRNPEDSHCHHCNTSWDLSHLNTPLWRIEQASQKGERIASNPSV